MSLTIGVCKETGPGERRVAVVPDVVKRYRQLGAELCIENGAGDSASLADADFGDVRLARDPAEVLDRGQVQLRVQPATADEIDMMTLIGAGVAGLQAIATARRLGAVVTAYDVRPETKEQVESLGARFVDTGVSAGGSGGYARELTAEERQRQAEKLAKAVSQVDALITTAAIPGKHAPLIVDAGMVAGMKRGAVVVDMAADSGGNVAGTVAGETVRAGGVTIVGPTGLPSRMPVHASEMYAKNLFNFLSPFIKDGRLELDWNDEIVAGACLTADGEVRHAGVRQALGL